MVAAGAGMGETQGTGAMSLYNRNGTGENDFSAGGMAAELATREMMMRQKMTPPTGGEDMSRPAGNA